MNVVITIPAYNEEKTISDLIRDIKNVMSNTKYKYKILVVDDGSTDLTGEAAKKQGAVVCSHSSNLGLAETFRTEIKKSLEFNPNIIVHTDADRQYLARDIPKLIKEIENGYDLVLGNRFIGHIEGMPFVKRLGNKLFSRVISNIIKVKIGDAQTGFRAFTNKVAKEVNIISNHTYTQEQIIKAIKQGFKIKEVPVYFAKRDGKSRLMRNPFEYAVKAWINILRVYRDYEPLKFFGSTGMFLLAIGIIIGFYFIYLHFTVGIRGHLGLTLLMILSIVSGIQVILFGFLADMNKK